MSLIPNLETRTIQVESDRSDDDAMMVILMVMLLVATMDHGSFDESMI